MEPLKEVTLENLKQAIRQFNQSGIWQGILDRKLSVIGFFDDLKEPFMRAVELIPEEKEDELPDLVVDVYNGLVEMEEAEAEQPTGTAGAEKKMVEIEDVEAEDDGKPTEREKTPPIEYVEVDKFITKEPFKVLFPTKDEVLKAIKNNMKEEGYDETQVVIAWEKDGELVVLDGHTRLRVAKELGIKRVPAAIWEFDSEEEALDYVIHLQRDRRNLTDAEILACVEAVDRRFEVGRGKKNLTLNSFPDSASKTAKSLGISRSKVHQVRKVLDAADEQTKAEIKAGKKTIHQAYKDIKEKEKAEEKSDKKKQADIKAEIEKVFKPETLHDIKAILLKRLEGTEDKVKAVKDFHKAVKSADRRLEKLLAKVA